LHRIFIGINHLRYFNNLFQFHLTWQPTIPICKHSLSTKTLTNLFPTNFLLSLEINESSIISSSRLLSRPIDQNPFKKSNPHCDLPPESKQSRQRHIGISRKLRHNGKHHIILKSDSRVFIAKERLFIR
jgi:hypothetical protein